MILSLKLAYCAKLIGDVLFFKSSNSYNPLIYFILSETPGINPEISKKPI